MKQMTAVQKQIRIKELQGQWPRQLHELACTNVAVHQARSYFYATGDLEQALVGCIVFLSEGNANLMKQIESYPPPAIIIHQA